MSPSIAVVMIAALAGLAATWPVRRALGPVAWSLAGGTVGLLAWTTPALAATLTGSGWSVALVAGSLAAFVGVGVRLSRSAAGHASAAGVAGGDAHRYVLAVAAHLAVLGTLGGLVVASGLTALSFDSFAELEPAGWRILADGLVPWIVAWRGAMAPALHAADLFMGGEWPVAVYPAIALYVIGWLAYGTNLAACSLWPDSSPRTRYALATLVAGLLGSTTAFLFNALYVHTHMLTALMMLAAVVCMLAAAHGSAGAKDAWMLVAGCAALGVVLARPDGLAYVVVLHIALGWMSLRGLIPDRAVIRYWVVVLGGGTLSLGVLVGRFGLFEGGARLSAVGMVAALAGSWIVAACFLSLSRLPRIKQRLAMPLVAIGLLVLADAALLAVACISEPRNAEVALQNWITNALATGGYNSLWIWAAAVIAVSMTLVWSGSFRSRPQWLVLPLVSLQFAATAALVHIVTHPGRLQWYDSLNRVMFHIAPLVFVLFAVCVAVIAEAVREG